MLTQASFSNDTVFSDLTIKCGAETYRLHKLVVASRAGVLAKALKFPGKVLHCIFDAALLV